MATANAPRPFGLFERMLALRYVRATRQGGGVSLITLIAFFGIMLSVATLIVVMSVMQGFRFTLLDQLLGVNGHIFLQPFAEENMEDPEILRTLRGMDGVDLAIPVLKVEAYAVNGRTGQAPVLIQGVGRDDFLSIDKVTGGDALLRGSYEGFGQGDFGGNGIAMGSGVARALGVTIGQTVTLVTAGGRETPFGRIPLTQKGYRVDAIFAVGNSEYDSILVYMPLEQAQLFAGKRGQITEIEMRVERPQEVDLYLPAIEGAAFGKFQVFDWRDRFRSFFMALEVERGLMRIILSMIIAIATLLIFAGLWMLVKDKTADIAILRTIGTPSGSVLRIFLMIGSLIGLLGALLGVLVGTLIASNIDHIRNFLDRRLNIELFPPDVYYLDQVPSVFEAGEVASVLLFTLLMSLVFSVYPAWRASRLDPVEALRYE